MEGSKRRRQGEDRAEDPFLLPTNPISHTPGVHSSTAEGSRTTAPSEQPPHKLPAHGDSLPGSAGCSPTQITDHRQGEVAPSEPPLDRNRAQKSRACPGATRVLHPCTLSSPCPCREASFSYFFAFRHTKPDTTGATHA